MAARLARLTQTYSIHHGSERAQCTTWYLSPSGVSLLTMATALQAPLDTLWTGNRLLHTGSVAEIHRRLDEVRVTDGRVLTGTDIDPSSTPTGSAGGSSMPPEAAEVLTLRTPFSGASFRGRIYLPPVAVSECTSDGDISEEAQHAFVDNWATFFDAVIADASDITPVVYSRKNRSTSPISRIDMGTIMDVQRSRRRSLVEVRYSVGVA